MDCHVRELATRNPAWPHILNHSDLHKEHCYIDFVMDCHVRELATSNPGWPHKYNDRKIQTYVGILDV